jgi:predicted TIM-barrel fold metal-dependent hydrolase
VIIDAHAHLNIAGPEVDQKELSLLLRRADAAGIERVVLIGSVIPAGPQPNLEQVRATNEQTMAAVAQRPDRLWGLCYVNPRHGEAARDEILRCVRDGPLRGVKLWVAALASDPTVEVVAEVARDLGVPILQHAWDRTDVKPADASTSGDVAELARRYPDLRIQMAHMGGVGYRGMNAVSELANVWVDTSGAQPVAGLVEYGLRRLGAERIVFGSDYPVRDFAVKVAAVRSAGLDPAAGRAVWSENAQRMYGTRGGAR